MLFTPYSPPTAPRYSPSQRRRVNRFALLLFALAATAGLLVKCLG